MGENKKVKLVPALFGSLSFRLNALPFISSYILKTHVSEWIVDECPIIWETTKHIYEASYCDDVILTADEEDKLVPMTKAMIEILAEAGLPVSKFFSNSIKTLKHFPDRCELKDNTSLLGCMGNRKRICSP